MVKLLIEFGHGGRLGENGSLGGVDRSVVSHVNVTEHRAGQTTELAS